VKVGRVDAFWAGFFGLPARALAEPGTHVVPHARLGDYSGAWFFVRLLDDRPDEGARIASAPPAWCELIRDALDARGYDALLSEEALRALFGGAFRGTVGPAYHGWLDAERFRPRPSPAVRELAPSDARRVAALRAACGERDWQSADLRVDAPGACGWFEDGELLAAASLTDWGEGVVGPGVLSRPASRRTGCGTGVCSAAVAAALAAGKSLTYQTLMVNTGALRIASSLGFEPYASHLAVRLGP
jgi:hypothetical protein